MSYSESRHKIHLIEWASGEMPTLGAIPALADVSLELAVEARGIMRRLNRTASMSEAIELERALYRVACRGVVLWDDRRRFAASAAPQGQGSVESEPLVALACRVLEAEPVRASGRRRR